MRFPYHECKNCSYKKRIFNNKSKIKFRCKKSSNNTTYYCENYKKKWWKFWVIDFIEVI